MTRDEAVAIYVRLETAHNALRAAMVESPRGDEPVFALLCASVARVVDALRLCREAMNGDDD